MNRSGGIHHPGLRPSKPSALSGFNGGTRETFFDRFTIDVAIPTDLRRSSWRPPGAETGFSLSDYLVCEDIPPATDRARELMACDTTPDRPLLGSGVGALPAGWKPSFLA